MNIEHVLLLLEIKLPMNWTLVEKALVLSSMIIYQLKIHPFNYRFLYSLDENEGILDPLLNKW